MIQRLIAEVSVKPSTTGTGFDWYLFAPGLEADQGVGNAASATEAVWRAADTLRDAPQEGRLGVLSPDGSMVAHVPVCLIPGYESLRWQPTIVQQVDLIAVATSGLVRASP